MACYGAQQRLLGSVAATRQEEAIGDIAMKGVVKSQTQLLDQSTQISSQAEGERCYNLWVMNFFIYEFIISIRS